MATCTVQFASGKCGRPAVYTEISRSGEEFAECAEHAAQHGSLSNTRSVVADPQAVHAARRPTSFDVMGQTVRYRGDRRFLVVSVRPEAIKVEGGYLVAFARVEKRTDNINTASDQARKSRPNGGIGVRHCVVDTTTGDTVEKW